MIAHGFTNSDSVLQQLSSFAATLPKLFAILPNDEVDLENFSSRYKAEGPSSQGSVVTENASDNTIFSHLDEISPNDIRIADTMKNTIDHLVDGLQRSVDQMTDYIYQAELRHINCKVKTDTRLCCQNPDGIKIRAIKNEVKEENFPEIRRGLIRGCIHCMLDGFLILYVEAFPFVISQTHQNSL